LSSRSAADSESAAFLFAEAIPVSFPEAEAGQMFCIKCGKENSDGAIYCQKCGSTLEPEDETRVARRDAARSLPDQHDESETKIFSVTPTLKFVYAGYLATVLVSFLVVVLLTIFFPDISAAIAVLVGLLLLFVPLYFHLKKKLVRYTLTDTTVEIDRGLISRTTQNIPLRRIQDVTVSATVMQRMLGFGDVIIDNASEDGAKIVLDDIDSPKKYAELMLRQMRHLER
jgi:membrane protein YdbS with pleckstrin-like domain